MKPENNIKTATILKNMSYPTNIKGAIAPKKDMQAAMDLIFKVICGAIVLAVAYMVYLLHS